MDDEAVSVLSIGMVIEPGPQNRAWEDAVNELSSRVEEALAGVTSPLNVNVVFFVPGRTFEPEFAGVRTGRFSKRDRHLMVQIAVPRKVPLEPELYVRIALARAVEEAERWAVKRKTAFDLFDLRALVESL